MDKKYIITVIVLIVILIIIFSLNISSGNTLTSEKLYNNNISKYLEMEKKKVVDNYDEYDKVNNILVSYIQNYQLANIDTFINSLDINFIDKYLVDEAKLKVIFSDRLISLMDYKITDIYTVDKGIYLVNMKYSDITNAKLDAKYIIKIKDNKAYILYDSIISQESKLGSDNNENINE